MVEEEGSQGEEGDGAEEDGVDIEGREEVSDVNDE